MKANLILQIMQWLAERRFLTPVLSFGMKFPIAIRQLESTNAFKSHLKTFYFSIVPNRSLGHLATARASDSCSATLCALQIDLCMYVCMLNFAVLSHKTQKAGSRLGKMIVKHVVFPHVTEIVMKLGITSIFSVFNVVK